MFKHYRNHIIILTFCLIALSILSCLPYAPQGPFDDSGLHPCSGTKA